MRSTETFTHCWWESKGASHFWRTLTISFKIKTICIIQSRKQSWNLCTQNNWCINVYGSVFTFAKFGSDLRILLEKAMAPHSSSLAWKIPWTEEPGRLQSMGSLRVEHNWAPSLSLFTFMHWRRKWQPTPVFLPGESQGRQSLVGCHLWGRTESDTTEAT